MEDYPFFDERPLERCLKDVDRCQILVGIIGRRYGHIPAERNPEGLSITELEYRHAERSGAKRLMFLLDNDAKRPREHDDRYTGAGDAGLCVRRFRESILARHGVPTFREPEELAGLVLEAILSQVQHLPAKLIWPKPWNFQPYIDSKRREFCGRQWLFDSVEQWRQADASRALLIRSTFGVGKSAFLAELVSRNPHSAVIAHHFCQHDTQQTLNPYVLVRSLASQIARTVAPFRHVVEESPEVQRLLVEASTDPASILEAAVLEPLREIAPPAEGCLVVIDALDEALEFKDERGHSGDIVDLLAAKSPVFPSWLRILVTTRNVAEIAGRLRHTFAVKDLDDERALNEVDLSEYIRSRLAKEPLCSLISASATDSVPIRQAIAEKSSGKFLYAARLLNDLSARVLTPDQIEAVPPGIDAFYLAAFDRVRKRIRNV